MVISFIKKMNEIINLKNVSLILEKKQIYNLNLKITNGDFFVINRRNATGKSTLLKLFCLKILPSKGSFLLKKEKVDSMIKNLFWSIEKRLV